MVKLIVIFYIRYIVFCSFVVFLILSCATVDISNFEGLHKDSKYVRLVLIKNKISLRHYFTISGKFDIRYKEPLFLQCGKNIVASFLFERYQKIGNAYIHTFFSVGKDISLKVYLDLVKAGKFVIINSSSEILKTIIFSHLPDSEDILVQNNKII